MKWIICHQSALEIWRKTHARDAVAGKKLRTMKLANKPLDINELQSENLRHLSKPLHVLVGSKNARKASKSLYCHITLAEIPDGSFVRMPSGLIVSSPELCFLQMASELSFIDLIRLGYEFCGSYRLDKGSDPDKGFRSDPPLTSVKKLSSYAAKAVNLKGCKNARRAINFVADGSASPMETVLAMLLTLPYRLGGYGFPKPMLNYRIDVPFGAYESNNDFPALVTITSAGTITTKSFSASADISKYYCDLYWPEKKVAVEYDSDAFHTGSDRIAKDAIRRNALTSAGVTVITVSRSQITTAALLRNLAEDLSKLLGKRLTYSVNEFTYRQGKLLDQLVPINTMHGSANI